MNFTIQFNVRLYIVYFSFLTKRESFLWGKGGGAQREEVPQLVAQPGILVPQLETEPRPHGNVST